MTKNEIIDNITEWFRSKYDLKVDYSTMTISIKKKNERQRSLVQIQPVQQHRGDARVVEEASLQN